MPRLVLPRPRLPRAAFVVCVVAPSKNILYMGFLDMSANLSASATSSRLCESE